MYIGVKSAREPLLYYTLGVLMQAVQIGSGQPSIEDVMFSGNVAKIRWETQCTGGVEEETNITYACSRTKFIDSDFNTVSHRTNTIQHLRERLLPLTTTDTVWQDGLKCVFKLQGVQNEDCTTKDSICVLVEVKSYTMLINGKYNNI